MKRRVVVTGLGAVTPIGNTVEEFWNGIKAGKVGIGEITKFDTTEYKVKIAAEVKNFQAKERMDFKAARRMEPFSQYAVAAAKEAFEDAGLDMSKEDPYRVGVIVGSGIGSNTAVRLRHQRALADDTRLHAVNRFFRVIRFHMHHTGDFCHEHQHQNRAQHRSQHRQDIPQHFRIHPLFPPLHESSC